MVTVNFTPALKQFEPELKSIEVTGNNVKEVIGGVREIYPRLVDYVLEENGALRKHVNIFINNTFINDRQQLSDTVQENDKVYIIQALSGG